MLKFVAIIAASIALLACGPAPAPDGDRSAEVHCPVGQTRVEELDGGVHCWIPGDLTNIDHETCHPIACQVWSDYGRFGGGGEPAMDCSAACAARCAGETRFEKEILDEVAARGWPACLY